MKTFTTHNEQETHDLAAKLAETLQNGDVVAYKGGMGVGKTAFTRGLAYGLGIDENVVSSPTFAIIQEYSGNNKKLAHFDMYRIEDYDSLYSTGYFDYLDTNTILAIEWSENITEYLPENSIFVEMFLINEETREITISGGSL